MSYDKKKKNKRKKKKLSTINGHSGGYDCNGIYKFQTLLCLLVIIHAIITFENHFEESLEKYMSHNRSQLYTARTN